MILHYKIKKWFEDPSSEDQAGGKKQNRKLRIKPRIRLFRMKHFYMFLSQEFGKI